MATKKKTTKTETAPEPEPESPTGLPWDESSRGQYVDVNGSLGQVVDLAPQEGFFKVTAFRAPELNDWSGQIGIYPGTDLFIRDNNVPLARNGG